MVTYKDKMNHRLRTPGEEITFTARPKIKSQSQILRYGRSIFCLPHRPKNSDFFDLCPHWVSVVREINERNLRPPMTAQRKVYYDQVKGFLNSSDLSKESDTFVDCLFFCSLFYIGNNLGGTPALSAPQFRRP